MEEIIANDHVKVLDDCLFCVHLQRQYSAARELEEFLKTKNDSNADDGHAAKYFQALKVRTDLLENFITPPHQLDVSSHTERVGQRKQAE